jgi:hypothetical protein
VAPQLRGEGNWPNVALYAAYTARIFFAVDAMLSAVPFWFKVRVSAYTARTFFAVDTMLSAVPFWFKVCFWLRAGFSDSRWAGWGHFMA